MTYTVRDLIERLGEVDPNTVLLVASDEEGNSIRSLYEVGAPGLYLPDGNEFYMNEEPYQIGSEPPDSVKAVVLWP
jgi:hypothetical protein